MQIRRSLLITPKNEQVVANEVITGNKIIEKKREEIYVLLSALRKIYQS